MRTILFFFLALCATAVSAFESIRPALYLRTSEIATNRIMVTHLPSNVNVYVPFSSSASAALTEFVRTNAAHLRQVSIFVDGEQIAAKAGIAPITSRRGADDVCGVVLLFLPRDRFIAERVAKRLRKP